MYSAFIFVALTINAQELSNSGEVEDNLRHMHEFISRPLRDVYSVPSDSYFP